MTVLVTGACGFVGCHIVEALARAFPSTSVVAADLTPPDPTAGAVFAHFSGQVVAVGLDVGDRAAVADLVGRTRPETIVHAAAITPTPEQERADPVRIMDINFGGLANVLRPAQAVPGLRRVVFLSSTGVFGPAAGSGPLDEEADPRPSILYGIAKRAGEDLLRRWSEVTGIGGASLRLGAIFGRHERPTPHRGRMSAVGRLLAAGAGGREVAVHGRAVLRDWLDGDDLGAGVARLVAAPTVDATLYHATGERLSFVTVVEAAEAGGLRCRWVDDPAAADVAQLVQDNRPATPATRFEREFGPLCRRPVVETVREMAATAGAAA